MNQKIYPMLLGALLVCCWSCQQEEPVAVPVSNAQVSLSVSDARQWFDLHLASQREITDEVTGQTLTRIPRWNQAQVLTLSGQGSRIRVPLDYAEDVSLGAGAENTLEIYRDENYNIQAQVLKFIRNEESFLNAASGSAVNEFSGVVLTYDWEDNFKGGSQIIDGKTAGELTPASEVPDLRVARTRCQEITIEYYVEVSVNGVTYGTTLEYEKGYLICYSEDTGGGGEGSGGGGPIGGVGSPSGGTGVKPKIGTLIHPIVRSRTFNLYLPGAERAAINLQELLSCFGKSQSGEFDYSITVYVDEPAPGTNSSSMGGNVGHTCIGLTKTPRNNPSGAINQVFGFYPASSSKALSFSPTESKVVNNGGGVQTTAYTVSVTYSVSPQQFQEAMNAAGSLATAPYDLDDNNCTDFVFNILNQAGVNIPQNKSNLLFSKGHHPGQLGYDLRQLKKNNPNLPISTQPGNTPNSSGPCI